MGIFDKFKKKNESPQATNEVKHNSNADSTYLDDITFIQDMKHVTAGPWHQYDILLASRPYGWDFMVKWVDYMSSADIKNISEVLIGELNGGKADITDQFSKNENKISNLSEAGLERGMISIAGMSIVLNAPVKIVWVNQTRALRMFTLVEDAELIKKYIETAARWSFGTENAMKLGKPIPTEK